MKNSKRDTCRTGSIYEKRFELFCLENGIEIWKPIGNQTHEDYVIWHESRFKKVNIKYRSFNKHNRFAIQLISKSGGIIKMNYLDSDIDCLILATDRLDGFFLLDLGLFKNTGSKYPSISLTKEKLLALKLTSKAEQTHDKIENLCAN